MRSFLLFVAVIIQSIGVAQDARVVDSLRRIINAGIKDSSGVNAMNKLAGITGYNQPDSAKILSRKAIELARKFNYQKGIADGYHVIGSAFTNQGNYDSALVNTRRSLFIREKIKDKRGISISNNNLGLIYFNQGDYEKAVKYYLISSKMDEELKDKEGVAISFNNIGLIYFNQSNYKKAEEFFDQTLEIYTKLGKEKGVAGAYSNLGGVYYYQKKFDKAIEAFKGALSSYEKLGDERYIASNCTNLGEVLADLKQYKDAMSYIKRAISLESKLGNRAGLCYAQLALAKMQMQTNSYLAAESTLLEAQRLAESINAKKQLSASLEMLAQTRAKLGNYRGAYDAHIRFTQVNDSVINLDKSTQINDMVAKYESDRKSREIELLKRQKEIQKLQQNAEKSKNKIIRNSLIAAFIIILIVAALIYNRYQVKQRANVLLQEKNDDIQKQKEQIEQQANELTEKNKEITDSIHYAKRIQLAILPPADEVKKILPDSFVLYKPKDIVSGDFYWVEEKNGRALVAAVDCTGHGVPGALMSVVGSNMLNQILSETPKVDTAQILDHLNKYISRNLQQRSQEANLRDGMDLALCAIDFKGLTMDFSAAMNSGYIVREKELIELVADKLLIGTYHEMPGRSYTKHTVSLMKGDMIYLFTDGYADQFGGPKGKKFKYKQLLDLLLSVAHLPAEEQRKQLDHTFELWRGPLEQVDDVCIIGIRV